MNACFQPAARGVVPVRRDVAPGVWADLPGGYDAKAQYGLLWDER